MPANADRAPRIRLLEVTKAFYIGGTEVQVLELLRGLPRHYQLEVAVLEQIGPLCEEVWGLGLLPREFPLGRSFLSPTGVLQVARLAAHLKASGTHLVHAHDFYSTLLAVPAAKLAGVKVVVGRLDLLHWHGPARARALAALTRLADGVVANAEAVRRHLLERERLPEEKIALIRNGIDLARFDARRGELEAPLPNTGGAPLVVHLANMSHPVKRQEDLLRALALARKKVGEVHAFFVGDGYRRRELQALATALDLEESAHFLGFRKDTPAILSRGTLGVLCSSKEGLSNAVIEGMAARLPMVVTDVGGNPELVAHGERGLVVPPQRPQELADAIVSIIANRAAARALGDAGRAFVEKELTLDQLISRHDQLYRAIAREI